MLIVLVHDEVTSTRDLKIGRSMSDIAQTVILPMMYSNNMRVAVFHGNKLV